jgi:hypothetical protein
MVSSTARGLVSTAKEVMPRLHDIGVIVTHKSLHLCQLVRRETSGLGQSERRKPKLRDHSIAFDMDVRRFVEIVTREKQPIRTDPLEVQIFSVA